MASAVLMNQITSETTKFIGYSGVSTKTDSVSFFLPNIFFLRPERILAIFLVQSIVVAMSSNLK
jgi:hypothetical protein